VKKAMYKRLNKCVMAILLISISLLNTGCWDYNEIQKRGYVLGVAIDLATEKDLKEAKLQKIIPEAGRPIYAFTIQLPIIANAKQKPVGTGGGSSESEKTWNLKILGNSFFEAEREFATRLDYPPFFEHLKVIVISEDAARKGIYDFTDFLTRDHEMRRRTKVFITPGTASSILEVTPKIADYVSLYLRALPENATKTSRMPHITDLGKISLNIHSNNDFVLPKIIASKSEIKSVGAAVFKKDKMVGWLDELQTNYLKWIDNLVKGGTITISGFDNKERIIALELSSVKTDVKPKVENGDITFNIESKAKANIEEISYKPGEEVFDESFIHKVERAAEEKVKKGMQETIKTVQDDYGTDIFFFHRALKRYAPDTWDKVQDNWDEIFPNVRTNVKVTVKIENIGTRK
jgi:Ger(x)C family germination protein